MRPYVVKQGDHLQQLAFQLGFNADAVWNDPSNGDLQKLRKDPNILFPGDVLQIPDAIAGAPTDLAVGTTNAFTSDPPRIPLNVQFTSFDPTAYASKAFTVVELPGLPAATTDSDGAATFPIPVTLTTATVVFTESGDTFVLAIAEMDPINTLSGIFKRLQNLGHIGKGTLFDATNLETIRAGLRRLKETKADASSPASSADPSSASPDSSPASSPSPAGAPDSGAPASLPSSPASASQPPASQPSASQPSPSQPPPSQPPTSQPPASTAPASSDGLASSPPAPDSSPSSSPSSTPGSDDMANADDAGLADDGTLADDVQQLLIKAYGC